MKNTLLKYALMGLALSTIAVSTFAMEEVKTLPTSTSDTAQRVLKFQITETGDIEDAKGSNLMMHFRESLDEEIGIWKFKKEKCLALVEALEAKLQGMELSESERYVIEAERAGLIRKVKTLETRISGCTEKEVLLKQVLREVPRTQGQGGCSMVFNVLNWEALHAANFLSLETIKFNHGPFYQEDAGSNMWINCQIRTSNQQFHSKFWTVFQQNNAYKLINIQKEIAKLSRLYFQHLDKSEETKWPEDLQLATIQKLALSSGKSVADIIFAEINMLETKVRTVKIPLLAPTYWMAQVCIAFQDEAHLHQPKVVAEINSDAPDDN